MPEKELNKYIVFNLEDLWDLASLDSTLKLYIEETIREYNSYRKVLGKDPDPTYIVCKQNEPYADAVWQFILEEEERKYEQDS